MRNPERQQWLPLRRCRRLVLATRVRKSLACRLIQQVPGLTPRPSHYSFAPHDQTQLPISRQRCVEGFFQSFHHSHPFLAPREYTINLLTRRPIPHLQAAISYIGSHYVSTSLTTNLALELETLLSSPDIAIDGFLVQALLLFVIGLDGNKEQSKALEVLARAQKWV